MHMSKIFAKIAQAERNGPCSDFRGAAYLMQR